MIGPAKEKLLKGELSIKRERKRKVRDTKIKKEIVLRIIITIEVELL